MAGLHLAQQRAHARFARQRLEHELDRPAARQPEATRLVDGAAAKLTDDFFARFVARLTPVQPGVAGTASSAAPLTVTDDAATPPPLAPQGGSVWIRYAAIAAIIVVLIVLYTRGYR